MRLATYGVIGALMLSVAACGNTRTERALTGAATGAAVGAAGTAIAGGSVGTGAAVGAVAGGLIGAVTSPRTIDLGDVFY